MAKLALIPARGGSKRVPGKNIRDFLGKPIIAYSIEAAISSNLFDEVMVSTDDEAIAEVALKYGAKVPFMRSNLNSDDNAPLSAVVDEVCDYYLQQNVTFEYGCCILATAPLIQTKYLLQAYEVLRSGTVDSVRPVVKFSYPIQRSLLMDSQGRLSWFDPTYASVRSQDIQPTYHDAGQFYWFRFEKRFASPYKAGLMINEIESQDIDTETDWKLAELKYKLLFGEDT